MRIDTPKFIQVLNLGVQGSYERSRPTEEQQTTLLALDVDGGFWEAWYTTCGLNWKRCDSGEWKD